MNYQQNLFIKGTTLIRCKKKATEVTIPKVIEKINDKAFSDCSYLKSISLPNSITRINKSVFFGCTSLQTITIPKSVTEIDDEAFSNCKNLVSITLPKNLLYVGNHIFDNCISLKKIIYSGTKYQWENIANVLKDSLNDVIIKCIDGVIKYKIKNSPSC